MTDATVYDLWSVRRLKSSPLASDARYGQVRLVVTRGRGEYSTAVVVVRTSGGRVLRDRRIGVASVHTPPGSAASQDPLSALRAALDGLEESKGV